MEQEVIENVLTVAMILIIIFFVFVDDGRN